MPKKIKKQIPNYKNVKQIAHELNQSNTYVRAHVHINKINKNSFNLNKKN